MSNNTALSLSELASKNTETLLEWLKNNGLTKRVEYEVINTFKNKMLEYQVKMVEQFSKTQTLLHRDQVPFFDIYFPLQIHCEYYDDNSKFISERKLVAERVTSAIFAKSSNILLLGNAGSGKTTLSKYIFLDAVRSSFKNPIIINLRDINIPEVENGDEEVLEKNIFFNHLKAHLIFYKYSVFHEIILNMLEGGKFLIMLDGYDEIDLTKVEALNKHVKAFSSRFSKNAFLLTSRYHAGAETIDIFKKFTISPLSTKDIPEFIRKQFLSKQDRVAEIILTIHKKENAEYLEYLTNPLFLILFLNSYELYPNLPTKKSRFFENVYDALFEKHDNYDKLGFNRKRLIKLKKDEFEKILYCFSFLSHFDGKVSFEKAYIEESLLIIKGNESIEFDIPKFITELKVNLNLLVEEGLDIKFVHRSIQEYFACKYLYFLSSIEKQDFFVDLAEREVSSGGNLFFLQLVSELFPNEFYEFYIKKHISCFLKKYNHVFQQYYVYSERVVKECFEMFRVVKEIISLHPISSVCYNSFIADNRIETKTNMAFYWLNLNSEKGVWALECLVLNQRLKKFFQILDDAYANKVRKNSYLTGIVHKKKG